MKIFVATYNDSDNLAIENILYELERRGHQLTIFAPYFDSGSIRMFNNLKANIQPFSDLTNEVVKKFDAALCSPMMMTNMVLKDTYCFVYSHFLDECFMPGGADFLFTYRRECMPRCDFRCAMMQVGDTKNGLQITEIERKTKQILYIDSGHLPFGKTGKKQIADMLLQICKNFPEYKLYIKPRWLRGAKKVNYTHRNSEHIYDVLEERSGGKLPSNLIMLNEHLPMQKLIEESECVITLYTSAILDVVQQNKGLLIISGLENEDKWDMRITVDLQKKYEMYGKTGCIIDYKEVCKYLPKGLHCHSDFLKTISPYRGGAAKRIADVIEYTYINFLQKGLYPIAQEYTYETYKEEMKEDKSLSVDVLKKERIRDSIQQHIALFSYKISVPIDFSKYYDMLEYSYKSCKLDAHSYAQFKRTFVKLKNEILCEQSELLMMDSIDQSHLFYALYDLGRENELLEIPSSKILCSGSHSYYLGKIYQSRGNTREAISYYRDFLKEANSRSYAKYIQEENEGIQTAYNYIFQTYDRTNISPIDFLDLCVSFYEQREQSLIAIALQKRVVAFLPELSKELAALDKECSNKCLKLYKNWQRDLKMTSIKRIEEKSQKVFWYIKRNGLFYTCKYILKKVFFAFEKKALYRIGSVYFNKVMKGYNIYEKFITKYGENAWLMLSVWATGDAYIFGECFEEYIAKNKINSAMISVLGVYGQAGAEIAALFGIKNILSLDQDEFRCLYNLEMFNQTRMIHVKVLHHHVFYRHIGIFAYLEGLHGTQFRSYVHMFLGIHSEQELTQPHFYYNNHYLYEFFYKKKLVPGKTIVLAPYAKSVRLIPIWFWKNLVKALNYEGLTVCTNSMGEEEPPIEGTIAAFVPYTMSVPFLEMAGACIGIRSGFLDVTNTAKCLKIALYPEDNYDRSLVQNINACYSMVEMYHQPDQYDIIYALDQEKAVIEEIVGMVQRYLLQKEDMDEHLY